MEPEKPKEEGEYVEEEEKERACLLADKGHYKESPLISRIETQEKVQHSRALCVDDRRRRGFSNKPASCRKR